MFSNCERMLLIPNSSTNEWPPQNHIDEKELMASTGRLVEKPGQEEQPQPQPQQQQQQQQQALKCPRCDSSNTKFCYYNNYSLSQPRHFCKACKRYWTRGGTLRNVPVGGGCRKNKRVKRPAGAASASASPITSGGANPNPTTISQPQLIDDINPFLYGLGNNNNPSDINLPFPRFNSRSVSDYDLQQLPQLSALGLGFSSGILSSTDGFNAKPVPTTTSSKTNQDVSSVTSSNPLLSSYSNMFGIGSSSSSTPTISSLLASTLHQQKFMNTGSVRNYTQEAPNHLQGLTTNFQDLQMTAAGTNSENNGVTIIKAEELAQSRSMELNNACQNINQLEQIGLSDPAAYWTAATAWHDPSNIGSSVTSLI